MFDVDWSCLKLTWILNFVCPLVLSGSNTCAPPPLFFHVPNKGTGQQWHDAHQYLIKVLRAQPRCSVARPHWLLNCCLQGGAWPSQAPRVRKGGSKTGCSQGRSEHCYWSWEKLQWESSTWLHCLDVVIKELVQKCPASFLWVYSEQYSLKTFHWQILLCVLF